MKILLKGTAGVDYTVPLLLAVAGGIQSKEGVDMVLLWTPKERSNSSLTIAITDEESADAVTVCLNLGDQIQDHGDFFSNCALPLDRIMKSQALEEGDDLIARAIAEVADNGVRIEKDGEDIRFSVFLGEHPAPNFFGRIELEKVRRFFDLA